MTDKASINSKLYIVVNADPVTGTPVSLKQQYYLAPSGGSIGAVKQGTNISIGGDGTISAFLTPGFAVTSIGIGAVGPLRTGDIRFISSANVTITDNGNNTFTWTSTGTGGATKLSALTDVKITEPILVNTMNVVTNVSPTVLTVNSASPQNLLMGDWIRGDNTENGFVTQILNISSNTITVADTDGFGFSTAIWKVDSVTQNGYALVWDTASNAFITKQVGGTLNVNGTVVASPNLQNNPLTLGGDYTVTGSNVALRLRDADVSAVADRQDAANLGSPGNLRTQVSGGSAATTLIINNFANPATMDVTVSGSLSAATLAAALNAAGSTTISNAQIGGTLLTVANYTAPGLANNQVQCNFPSGTTPAQVVAVFGGLRSDAVWAGTANASSFQFTTNNGSPRRAIPSLFAAGANVTLTRDATTDITTIAATGGSGGSTTLQGLTDVAITEPVFAQVGTATVVSISSATTSILVTSAAGIAVGDWLRGGTVMPGQVPALQVISIVGTLIEFNLDPTPFFAVGNFVYRLPENLEGARLSFSNAQNKWISSASLNFLPMDTISWVSLAGDPYLSAPGSPIVVAPITTNSQNLASPWTFGIGTLGTFPSPSEVCGTDALGRQVTGQYVSSAQAGTLTAVLEAIKFDRVSGGSFVINNTYPLTWRAGTYALPDYVRFNTTTNAITQGQAAVDGRIATNVGAIETTYTSGGVSSVTTGYGNAGTTWQAATGNYAAARTALAATGATAPAAAGNWTLPTYSIRISNIANPTATQFATISQIQDNPVNSVLVITFSGNPSYFANAGVSAQPLFTQLGKFTFVTASQSEVIRLANVNDVASLNLLKGDVTLVGGTSIGVATNTVNRQLEISYIGGGSGINSSNWTSFVNDQFPTPIGFVATSVGTGYANELYIGMGWNTDTEVLDGGFLNGTKYIGTSQLAPTTPGNGLIYFVATTYTDLEVIVNSPAWNCSFTTSGASAAGNFVVEGVIFARRTANAANPPVLNAQIFPGFQGNGSDDMRLVPILSPTFTITGSGTSFNIVATAGQYSGIINNYAHTDTTNDYIIWFRVYNNAAADNINGFSNLALTSQGGVRSLVAIPAAAVASSLAWDIYSVATRYNSAFTPVPNISATFTIPVATVTGTVHNYFRYSAAGAATSIYRFVPSTDSVLTTLSYDSYWSGFTGSVLSGLLIQRGQF